MIHSYKLLYLSIAAVALGAIKRHATTIEDALGIPSMIDSYLPAPWFWIVVAVLFALASLVPVDRQASEILSSMPKRMTKEDLYNVARRIAQMTSVHSPNIPSLLDYTIYQAIAAGASDIHFDPTREGFVVRYRIEGMMSDIARIPAKLTGLVSNRLKVLSNLVVYQGYLPQDGRLGRENDKGQNVGEIDQETRRDFRVAFMPTLHGERIVIRILGRSGSGYDFSDLGMHEYQQKMMMRFVAQAQGMIIFTGPTGSGKTTTIYAALRAIQSETNAMRSISTLEDPIEYEIAGINQSQVDEKKRFTFDKGLRAILRQDPDVIMVGEIRDSETARIAIQAGMTGHLIITTVHTNSSKAPSTRAWIAGLSGRKV